ncbi:unnamed protein product, partial [Rotaria sp. Silwood1]
MKVTESGLDDVGIFTIDGIHSFETNRIGGGGGGGGGGGAGAFIGRGGFSGGNSCMTDDCKRHAKIVRDCVLGGFVGFLLLLFSIYWCCLRHQGRPRQDNSIFINLGNQNIDQQEAYTLNPFQSGIWSSRYFQYATWHGPY